MLAELRTELYHGSEAIAELGRRALGRGKRGRGRPPKWMTEVKRRGAWFPRLLEDWVYVP
jgi:hypothetical protein